MTEPALEASDLVVERGDERVLDGASLSVDPGDRVLVQGESGTGKTTLFSVLGLLEPPDSGSMTLAGKSVETLSERDRADLRRTVLGYIYQDFKLVPDLNARDNVALPQDHRGGRDEAWLDELFDRLDIADLADRRPAELSGGEKQRVATARALANRPSVVLADEPTGQLDPDSAGRLMDLLGSLQREYDAALVVVSHDRSLEAGFPRTLRLVDGQLRS